VEFAMSFTTQAEQSVNNLRALVQLDISSINTQWVNAGAGIWYVNFDALYPEIETELLTGYTVQDLTDIGSVQVDTLPHIQVFNIEDLTIIETSFYYDQSNKEVYVHFVDNDEPYLHTVFLGVIYGYSYNEFSPVGANTLYEGRLASDLSIGESRDPLFFGKLQYSIGNVSLYNSDGFFDTFAQDKNLYGNEARVLIGFEDLPITDYVRVLTGKIEKVTIDEQTANFTLSDRRKSFSKSITYSCTDKNALEAIREMLLDNYAIPYNSIFYDTTAWGTAEALVTNITIDIGPDKTDKDRKLIEVIEDICASVFGIFIIDSDGKLSFKIIDNTTASIATIPDDDILNQHSIDYDPVEVISSSKVGYAKNWEASSQSTYTFYTDTSVEEETYRQYKVYNQQEFPTLLTSEADAIIFSGTILAYTKDVHGIGTVSLPVKYVTYNIGDIVDIEINREGTTMLGTKKCEIISKNVSLTSGLVELGYRIV
jgi:hypothetical protein